MRDRRHPGVWWTGPPRHRVDDECQRTAGLQHVVNGLGHSLLVGPVEGLVGTTPPPYDFTWAWVLRDEPDGTARLLVRERYAYTRPWARFLVEPVEAVSFVMSQKMLRGIRDRAEQVA